MKNIESPVEGFVCTAKWFGEEKQEYLFGPNTGNSSFSHQKFTTNGLIPFKRVEETISPLEELRQRRNNLGFQRVGLAFVRLRVAQRRIKEIYDLEGERNYVIVGEVGVVATGFILLGKSVKGAYGVAYAPVSNLELNGFKTITKFNAALHALTEVERQGHIYATLGTFHFKRIKIPRELLSLV